MTGFCPYRPRACRGSGCHETVCVVLVAPAPGSRGQGESRAMAGGWATAVGEPAMGGRRRLVLRLHGEGFHPGSLRRGGEHFVCFVKTRGVGTASASSAQRQRACPGRVPACLLRGRTQGQADLTPARAQGSWTALPAGGGRPLAAASCHFPLWTLSPAPGPSAPSTGHPQAWHLPWCAMGLRPSPALDLGLGPS